MRDIMMKDLKNTKDFIHKEQNWKIEKTGGKIEKQGIGKRDIVMI